MLGLEILYNSEDDFKLAAIDYAAEFTGSDSMAFAEEWLLHDHRDSRTESAESVSQDSLSDTREKLEHDIAYEFSKLGFNVHIDEVFGWLDRQASISEAKVERKWSCYEGSVQAEIDRLNLCIAELAAKPRSDLAQRMEVDSLENRIFDQQNRIDELQAQVDELTAERELHRSKLGECANLAEQIRNVAMGFGDAALVDLEGTSRGWIGRATPHS